MPLFAADNIIQTGEMKQLKRICVFCGSSKGARPEYEAAARELARAMVARNYSLIYGGANVGLMGCIADEALAAGGEVIGVIPDFLISKELAHPALTQLHVVKSMHERKALMEDLSDAFIAMPGGFGTFEEFCEILTWAQLGLHRKPCGLLNSLGYYDPLLAQFKHSVQEGFITENLFSIALSADNAEALLDKLEQYIPQYVGKWISKATS